MLKPDSFREKVLLELTFLILCFIPHLAVQKVKIELSTTAALYDNYIF